jgi:hypothetical protein
MGRPPLWAYYKDSKPEDCIDKPATRFHTSIAQMFDEDWDKYYKDLDTKKENRIVTKYKRLGSLDVFAVLYDNGNIIKSAEDFNTEEIKDIREVDLQGKFPVLNRRYNKQIR